MNYTHLSIEERCCLRKYYNEGNSLRKIAELMGRNVSTISREIMRNKTYMNCKPAYYPHTAQKKNVEAYTSPVCSTSYHVPQVSLDRTRCVKFKKNRLILRLRKGMRG